MQREEELVKLFKQYNDYLDTLLGLNESDWRFRKEAITKSVELTVAGDVYTMVANVFSTLQYDK